MNEQPEPTRVKRDRIRARLNRSALTGRKGILGAAELIGLAGGFFMLVLVIVGYLYFLLPARSRFNTLQSERTLLQSRLRDSQNVVRQGQSTDATVQSITQSLDAFETNRLVGASPGRMSLYDALNLLIRKNGLRNTSGPTYTPLDPTGLKAGTSGSRSVNTKWQSIYPGIAISLTVDGQYQNLRRFVRELETNKQFVIINSVELERATETDAAPPVAGESTGGARGSLVSLRLEMATYFQRKPTEGTTFESVVQ